MHVGRRIAKLRAAFGESLRDAAVRTGVSHTTIARIEKGEITGSFHSTLRKIAVGYGVRLEFLLTGRDPKHDFEAFLRRLSPEERGKLYFVPTSARIQLVINFLATEYPEELIDGWTGHPVQHLEAMPDDQLRQIASLLSRVTGIPEHWFYSGAIDTAAAPSLPTERMAAYIQVLQKAAQASIHPQMLEMAIDLLIMKHQAAGPAMEA